MRDLEQEYNPKTSDVLRRILHPGHHLKSEIEIEMLRFRPSSCKMAGRVFVDGELVCEAKFMAGLVNRA